MKKVNALTRFLDAARAKRPSRAGSIAAALGSAAIVALGLAEGGCIVVNPVDPPKGILVEAKPRTEMKPAALVPPKPSGLFQLKPEWEGPCARTDNVDVNLGNSPEAFVKAAYCQITGEAAPPKTVELWANRLRTVRWVRRVDVVRSLATEHKRQVKLVYSDPWKSQPDLVGAPEKKVKRDVGAVFMFFFDCPGKTNCAMDWASTHAPGMDGPHPLFGMKAGEKAVYSPSEPGFWRRELMDAKYAGLQFLMLNTYGPDIADGKLAPLAKALASLEDPVKIAFFDDTWTWGQPYFGEFWKQKPDLKDTEHAANTIYDAKWKPFFTQVDKRYWYRFKGKPFIYFYNSGTLDPRDRSAALVTQLKARFRADFGEDPFVSVDVAYFADPDMLKVADSRFTWMPLNMPDRRSRSRINGHLIDHAMVRWDAVGRDRPGELAVERDRMIKDGALLQQVLNESTDAEMLVLATWNDLGEGTGINRNYDYYASGRWLEPDYFMQIIRNAQSNGGK